VLLPNTFLRIEGMGACYQMLCFSLATFSNSLSLRNMKWKFHYFSPDPTASSHEFLSPKTPLKIHAYSSILGLTKGSKYAREIKSNIRQ
jgi:hypothetical protein